MDDRPQSCLPGLANAADAADPAGATERAMNRLLIWPSTCCTCIDFKTCAGTLLPPHQVLQQGVSEQGHEDGPQSFLPGLANTAAATAAGGRAIDRLLIWPLACWTCIDCDTSALTLLPSHQVLQQGVPDEGMEDGPQSYLPGLAKAAAAAGATERAIDMAADQATSAMDMH